jgi:23S rRNA (uridine2552-2'-O)-methyltransferase
VGTRPEAEPVSASGSGSGREGGRSLKQRVKTAKKRTVSQTRWLERQLNDPYVAQAKREGYRSRAAYKLIEMDEKFHLLKPGQKVVDLGAAPGGWSQIAARKVGSVGGKGRVIGIDLLDIDPIPGVEFTVMDFLDADAPERLKAMLGGPADVVMSDMAANATGHKKTDHLKIVALAELAIEFAREILAPGGSFVAKVLQGGTESTLLANLKRDFTTVRHVKPAASRAGSAELYVLATGFRGRGVGASPQDERVRGFDEGPDEGGWNPGAPKQPDREG